MAKYNYELRSINYWTLSPEEQQRVRRGFMSFLHSLAEPISFRVLSDVREVDVGGDIWNNPYKRFFIESEVSLEPAISYLGAKNVRVPSVPSLDIKTVLPLMMVDSESNLVQVFNVTNLSGSLGVGFLTSLYDIAYEVRVGLEPVDQYAAGKIARDHYISVGTSRWIISAQITSRSWQAPGCVQSWAARWTASMTSCRPCPNSSAPWPTQ